MHEWFLPAPHRSCAVDSEDLGGERADKDLHHGHISTLRLGGRVATSSNSRRGRQVRAGTSTVEQCVRVFEISRHCGG